MNRRKFIGLACGGVVLAAGAGVGVIASREPTSAYKPWNLAGGSLYSEPRRKALSYAILAPNPHNQQPWLVDLSTPDQVVLKVDQTRLLPHTDPFNRQITIGLGCFLELMRMAAANDGYRVELDIFPQGQNNRSLDDRIVAIARFIDDPAVKADPLFDYVLDRRSAKEPYDVSRTVPTERLTQIQMAAQNGAVVGFSNDANHVAELRALTHEALKIEFITPRTYKESVDLFRIGKAEVEANPDGIDLSGPMFELLHTAGLMTRESALDTNSTAYQGGLGMIEGQANTAMAHLWCVTDGNTRTNQINAGRDWVRINLAATALGIGIQPLSQALQEYEEMAELYAEVHDRFATNGGTVQMLARLGYTDKVGPSPRWPIEKKVIQG